MERGVLADWTMSLAKLSFAVFVIAQAVCWALAHTIEAGVPQSVSYSYDYYAFCLVFCGVSVLPLLVSAILIGIEGALRFGARTELDEKLIDAGKACLAGFCILTFFFSDAGNIYLVVDLVLGQLFFAVTVALLAIGLILRLWRIIRQKQKPSEKETKGKGR